MMFDGSWGFTATHGSSSLFAQLTSPGNRNPEMSHDENGLALDAWLTDVVAYDPAEAMATGKRINRVATAAASGMPLLIAFLLRSDSPGASSRPGSQVSTARGGSRAIAPDRKSQQMRPIPTGRRLRPLLRLRRRERLRPRKRKA